MPDSARPAMTFLLDILESRCFNEASGDNGRSTGSCDTASGASGTHDYPPPNPELSLEPTMSIRFFLPRELYGVWNEAVRRYLAIISPEDGIELFAEGEGRDRFIAQLLSDYLSVEHAHHKVLNNNEIVERDGCHCQVPGCSNCRNLHAHHLVFRSQGGCDEPWNELCLCTKNLAVPVHTKPAELPFQRDFLSTP
ncbi:MAG: HNH endonuclease [Candidatus Xenobiia bacterium LiM19]